MTPRTTSRLALLGMTVVLALQCLACGARGQELRLGPTGTVATAANSSPEVLQRLTIDRPAIVTVSRTASGGIVVSIEFRPKGGPGVPPIDPDDTPPDPEPPVDPVGSAVDSAIAKLDPEAREFALNIAAAEVDKLKAFAGSIADIHELVQVFTLGTVSAAGASGNDFAPVFALIGAAMADLPEGASVAERLDALGRAIGERR